MLKQLKFITVVNLNPKSLFHPTSCGFKSKAHLVLFSFLRACGCAFVWSFCKELTYIAIPSNQLQSQLVCQHWGAAMGDVGKGPSMDKHWCTLRQLEGHTNIQPFRKQCNPSNFPSLAEIPTASFFTKKNNFQLHFRVNSGVWMHVGWLSVCLTSRDKLRGAWLACQPKSGSLLPSVDVDYSLKIENKHKLKERLKSRFLLLLLKLM